MLKNAFVARTTENSLVSNPQEEREITDHVFHFTAPSSSVVLDDQGNIASFRKTKYSVHLGG